MLLILVFAALVCGSYAGGPITDLNCTRYDTAGAKYVYTETAFNCQNTYPDALCTKLYDQGGNALAIGNDNERPDNCFKVGAAPNDAARQAAIKTCPHQCGYCCLASRYNCKNKPNPRILCELVTPDMCNSIQWKKILVEDCPNTCGFCAETGDCRDLAVGCGVDPSICKSIPLQEFVKENCKRTCGFCSGGGGNGGSTADCGNDPKCANWIRNGFCTNTFYTPEQKKKYCGKPCGLC